MAEKYLLSFKGNKQELHAQLKDLCKLEGESMNTTILDLIKKHLNDKETKRNSA
jgi:hypothetical protein